MSLFRYFKPKTFFTTCFIHSCYVLLVLGGCQRTNPGWIPPDDNTEYSTETKHLTAPSVSFMPGHNNFNAAWNKSLVSVYQQCYDEVQIWAQKKALSGEKTLESHMLCQQNYKKNKDNTNSKAASPHCSFNGNDLFCGRTDVGIKQTLPSEYVVDLWISLINNDHRKGMQTIRAPSILTIDPVSSTKENSELLKLICDSNPNAASADNTTEILLNGIKSRSNSCQALIPSWKQSSVVGDRGTGFMPNITYPSGSRG